MVPPEKEVAHQTEGALNPIHHYGPVTALRVFENFLLAGYGPILKIFQFDDVNAPQLIFNKQVFAKNKIHHIHVNSETNQVSITGGRSFMVIPLHDLVKNTYIELGEKTINEWIVSSFLLDANTLLLLNSHNTVVKVDLQQNYRILEKIDCGEKSILYSGTISQLPDGAIYVAAGTVMNGAIIWDLASRKIKHNLTEHEGSIFGVKIDYTGNYIISCSDDRSIKLHSFHDGKLLATGWGHGSRIWSLDFFKPDSSNKSSSEDCTMRIWEYVPGNEMLQQIDLKEQVHRGKHIWSGDVDNLNLKIAVTGGADGKIRLHDLTPQHSEQINVASIPQALGLEFAKSEFIRDYFEVPDYDTLVILTSKGNLMMYQQGNFHSFGVYKEFSSFGIVSGFSELNLVLVSGPSGEVLCLDFNHTGNEPKLSWINNVAELIGNGANGRYFAIFECPNPNVPFYFCEFECANSELKVSNVIEIPKIEPKCTLTAFTVEITTKNWVVLAFKKATIQVVDLQTLNTSLFRKVSPGDTISSVSVVSHDATSTNVLILARDGVYTIAQICEDQSSFTFDVLQQNKIVRGFIEGGYIVNSELILYGFKSSYFYVWNETKQIEIMNVHCGGSGHRHYKFYKNNQSDYFKFVFTSKTHLCIFTHQVRFTENYGLIQNGTHGREIRDIAISRDNSLVLTSSEDSSIGVSKINGNGEIVGVWNMNNHVSGMQKVKFLSDKFAASSAANEEFIIWKITWMESTPMVVEHARLQPTKSTPDLRVMDFCSIATGNGFLLITVYSDSNVKVWDFDIDQGFKLISSFFYSTCCILNCELLKVREKGNYLVLGTTDGFVSIWDLADPTNVVLKTKKQLHQSGVKATCIFDDDNGDSILVTGGDDNSISVSRITADVAIEVIAVEENAASATITSIAYVGSGQFVVTSVDQIVRLWRFQNGKLTCLVAKYTTVADTGCCEIAIVNEKPMAVIGGAGMSCWEVQEIV
ncbi:RTT10 Regulator of Ty1 transposition protein 10 [Candida maltosa Xu316]